MRKIIYFSKTRQSAGHGARLVKGDAIQEIRRLKAEPGGHLALSSAELAASCNRHGLVDKGGKR